MAYLTTNWLCFVAPPQTVSFHEHTQKYESRPEQECDALFGQAVGENILRQRVAEKAKGAK